MEEKKKEKRFKIDNIWVPLFILASILFAIPSLFYLWQNKTVYQFESYFQFLYSETNQMHQTIIYLFLLAIITILFIIIIKNRKKIFANTKKMFLFIAVVSIIFMTVLPFTSSDIFYYLGIGRLDSEYGQNPYYTTIKEFVEQDDNMKYLEQDTVLAEGYHNPWSDTTVVYGPIWTLICKIAAAISFGNIDIGLLVFKLINVIVHLLNCYFIYKISKKKLVTLLYGINPFVLIEGIACVHNDIFLILLMLVTFFFLVKKKNLVLSLVFLALATTIKYFPIIILPFIVIYYFRKEKPSKRLVKCIQYGVLFVFMLGVPYLLYLQDLQVINGLFVQQQKLAKSFYIIVTEYFSFPGIVDTINKMLLGGFTIIYFFTCITLLNKKEIKFGKEIRKAHYFILAFLFLLITNFQPWYIMWLFPCMIWQKADTIKLIIQTGLISQFANSIFLLNGEGWKNGTPFTFFMITSILGMAIINEKMRRKRQIECFTKQNNRRKKIG